MNPPFDSKFMVRGFESSRALDFSVQTFMCTSTSVPVHSNSENSKKYYVKCTKVVYLRHYLIRAQFERTNDTTRKKNALFS